VPHVDLTVSVVRSVSVLRAFPAMVSAPPRRYRKTASSISMVNWWPGDCMIRFRLILARTASSTSSGVAWKPELACSNAFACAGVCKNPGTTVEQ
jgi:hypothetical protein